jgi:soluble lytic murein transglycosylase-like protein
MVPATFSPEPSPILNFLEPGSGVLYLERMMIRTFAAALAASLVLAPDLAGQGAKASEYDHLVAKHAAAHGVPESLVRRVIHIESKGNPRVVNSGNYGLMQIRLGTARAMGYGGGAEGLLDADTNMNYAVRYLAGAYRAASGNAEQAIRNYQRGYYDRAKAQGFSPYTVASVPPQAAAPDPVLLRQQQEIERRRAAEQQRLEQRQAMLRARVEQQRAAEQERVARRQAMLQERIDRQHAIEQQRIERQKAAEQKRIEVRQAVLQQQTERELAKQQQRIERAKAREQQAFAAQRPPHAGPVVAPKRVAADPSYAWYNPMRYFRHPSHQAHPLQR